MTLATTRARTGDPQTSKDAARAAATHAACQTRIAIRRAIDDHGPQTAREIAARIGVDYYEVQRRISEVGFIEKTAEQRGGCLVWKASA